MDARSAGLVVVVIGFATVVVGLLLMAGVLSWAGRLPGDIRFTSGGTRVFIPVTTMIVVSVALSLVSFIVRRFF